MADTSMPRLGRMVGPASPVQAPDGPAEPGTYASGTYDQTRVPDGIENTPLGVVARGEVTYKPCHCGPAFDAGVRYNTWAEDEASGRFPVQPTSTGAYPGPYEMRGVPVGPRDGNTDDTYQRDPGGIKMTITGRTH